MSSTAGQLRRGPKKNPYCIFTSAGDNSNVASWLPPDGVPDWDLIVDFYGKSEEAYNALAKHADIIFRCKGGKFQNLKALVTRQPGLLQDYQRIWVADDDLIFTTGNVNRLFEVSEQFGFVLCQPAFNRTGRISHEITAASGKGHLARIVNFVEVTCPLFETETLLNFIAVLDPELVSWGTDWWFCQYLNAGFNHRIAIIDSVVVLNPLEHQRQIKSREIDTLLTSEERHAAWIRIREAYKLREFEHKVLAEIFSSASY
jgi:hypothetical protein